MQQEEKWKSRYEKWKSIKAVLQDKDFERINGSTYINRHGWFKIASFFNLSFEIKEAERKETSFGGRNKIIWRYRVRVSSPDNLYSEAEGVASSDEFTVEKSENFLSHLAQMRAFTRAISFFTGSGEFSSEEIDSGMTIDEPRRIQQIEIDQEVVEKWEENEVKLQKEMINYSEAVSEEESEVEAIKDVKLPPTKRSEIFNQVRELMTSLGLKTPEERKKYASEVLGKDVGRGMTLSDTDLIALLNRLKNDVAKKKVA